jgi:hypothetical protein
LNNVQDTGFSSSAVTVELLDHYERALERDFCGSD